MGSRSRPDHTTYLKALHEKKVWKERPGTMLVCKSLITSSMPVKGKLNSSTIMQLNYATRYMKIMKTARRQWTYLKIAISRLMSRILATRRYPAMIIDTTTWMWSLSWLFVLKIVSPNEKKEDEEE